jgi:nucleotide-binding universal stress UspA family protein
MEQTKEMERRRQFSSPTATAPVLVGFDGAEGGSDALELGRVLSSIRGCDCTVALPEADGLLDEVEAVLGGAPKTHSIGVIAPGLMLVECAERDHAGTLVIGSSRRGKLGRALLGSVGDQVLRQAPCEVAVAPRGYASERHEGYAKIAVAVDGTPESKVALSRAEDLARQAGAKIEVLVADDPVVSDIEAEFPRDAPASMSNVLEAAIGSIDPDLAPSGKRVETGWKQVVRTIAAALAEACGPDVDLLVTGSRRPWEHFLAGSVTKHLITEAPCPVLIVPHSRQV